MRKKSIRGKVDSISREISKQSSRSGGKGKKKAVSKKSIRHLCKTLKKHVFEFIHEDHFFFPFFSFKLTCLLLF